MNNQEQSIQAIKANMQAFADAWNIHDTKQLATVFAEDADFVEVVAEFIKAGFIEQIYVHNDLSGAYLVVREHNESQVKEQFASFPMFPYMTLKIIQLQN
jgi:muconolactone D-isomerase